MNQHLNKWFPLMFKKKEERANKTLSRILFAFKSGAKNCSHIAF